MEAFRYDGKRVLVIGGATGMGAAAARLAAELGAEVVVMDVADVTFDVARKIRVDLRDRRARTPLWIRSALRSMPYSPAPASPTAPPVS